METSVFDFGSNVPKLEGRGFSPLLTANIDDEDHEYNALNDETFGAEAIDEDWESDHEKLASELRVHDNYLDDSSYQVDRTADEVVRSSIKQLVLDDELDDPAIMRYSQFPKKSVSDPIKAIFNRSPPPPALIGSDFTGSPLTDGIWSSPQRRDSAQTNFIDLSSLAIKPKDERHVSFNHNETKEMPIPQNKRPSSFGPIQLPPVKILPNAKTLEELERDLLMEPSNPPKAAVMTLQDVEREIYLKPRAKTVTEIESDMSGRQPPPTPGGIDLPPLGPRFPSQLPIGTPNSTRQFFNQSKQNVIGHYLNEPKNPQVAATAVPGAGIMPPNVPKPMSGPPPGFDLATARRPQMAPPPGNRIPQNAHMIGPPIRNFNGYPIIAHPLLNNIRYPPAAARLPQHPPATRFHHNVNYPDVSGFPQQHNNMGHSRNSPGGGYAANDVQESSDPYAGLMTQKEKDWLIKIQMMQLQSDNPYLDDYYFMLYKMKKMAKQKMKEQEKSRGGNVGPKLVLPERGKLEIKQYIPTQYQGSLGKIQAVSINNPRKMIDIVERNNEDDEEAKKLSNRELRRYRKGLVDIEKLYDLVLDVDDIGKKILALPQEAVADHVEEKKNLITRLFEGLGTISGGDKFVFIMSIRKGRRLVVRLFQLFNKTQQQSVLEAILHNFATILKRDQIDQVLNEIFPELNSLLAEMTFNEMLRLQNAINITPNDVSKPKNALSIAVQSKFGISVILSLLHHAESLFQVEEPEMEARTRWCTLVLSLHKLIVATPDSAMATPFASFSNTQQHFRRFVTTASDQNKLLSKLSMIMPTDDTQSATNQ